MVRVRAVRGCDDAQPEDRGDGGWQMRVLVTGAAGQIGRDFARGASDEMQLTLTDRSAAGASDASPAVNALDITDAEACRAAVDGIDAVLHLAADPAPDADFLSSVLPVNMLGTYNMITAACDAGIHRFVFASSAHAVSGYPLEYQVRESDAARPANDYGVGKAFGEALCASWAVRSMTTFVAIRIGNYQQETPTAEASLQDRMAWISPRDAGQLLGLCLTAAIDDFRVAHGVSNNTPKRLALRQTRAVFGYHPYDDAFAAYPLH
jgi:uronate dehydrogenase